MSKLVPAVGDLWFAPSPASRLAALRILVGAFALWYLLPRYSLYVRVVSASPELFDPVGLASILSVPMPLGLFQALLLATYVLNVAFLVGWRHSITGPVFGVLLLFILCYRNSWTMIYHSDNLLALHTLILGCTRAADAWSFDAWARSSHVSTRLGTGSPGTPGGLGWHYGWPLRLICVVTVITYLLSGVAKVAGPLGWAWASGEALRSQIAVDSLRKELLGNGAAPLVSLLYDEVWLFTILGMLSLVIELGAPLALLNRWVGRCWAVNALLMHWGILLIMDIQFEYSLSGIVFASFFPLERPVTWLMGRRPRTSMGALSERVLKLRGVLR